MLCSSLLVLQAFYALSCIGGRTSRDEGSSLVCVRQVCSFYGRLGCILYRLLSLWCLYVVGVSLFCKGRIVESVLASCQGG